jgi:hypothetical protein
MIKNKTLDTVLAEALSPTAIPVIVIDNKSYFGMIFDAEGRNVAFRPTLNAEHANLCSMVLLERFSAEKCSLAIAYMNGEYAAGYRALGMNGTTVTAGSLSMAMSKAMQDFLVKNNLL